MNWHRVSHFFNDDGSLRDIVVYKTTVSDWDKLISLSLQLGEVRYLRDSQEAVLPATAAEILQDKEHAQCMKVDIGGVLILANFFCVDEIEMYFSPGDVTYQDALDRLLGFCVKLSNLLERDVTITEESDTEAALLTYSNRHQDWVVSDRLALPNCKQ